MLVLAAVLCARDPLTFLAGWELMTLLPAAVILVARGADRASRRTVFVYLAITHLGGAGTWVAVLLLAHAGAFGGAGAIAHGLGPADRDRAGGARRDGDEGGRDAAARLAAAGAPDRAGAGLGADERRDDQGRDLRARAGARRLARACCRSGSACSCSALGALSAVGGVVYALFQHELKRLLALHSIENVGIIVLGLGACLLLRARGADGWAAFALAAALLHTLNHAVFKALLFLGAGAFERAVGSLELDRLGGLLRRMPWTGGAFLVGAMAIAGLPPLNGFASEWLTLQALLHVPAYGGVGDGLAGALALAALAATAALAVFCFVKVVGLVLLGPPRREASPRRGRGAAADARPPSSCSPAPASCSALAPGPAVRLARRARALAASAPPTRSACTCRAPGRCRRSGSRSCSSR